jgi:gliding motility-associated-like protein
MFEVKGRYLLSVLLGVLLQTQLGAQNYVTNPSFEDFTDCPTMLAQIDLATGWESTTAATPDFFHECGTGDVAVPLNLVGFQQPHTGRGYAGLIHVWNEPMEYREYITAELTEPLAAGVYEVGFWVSLADFYPCGTTQFGAHFSNAFPTSPPMFTEILPLLPQFKPAVSFITDISEWTLLSGCVLLGEGTNFITIGNFSSVDASKLDADCGGLTNPNAGKSYYFIDDVYLIKSSFESNGLDLGGPVIACDEYTIDPGVTGTSITWSNNSHLPTLTVTESGLYSVTISNGCDYVIGEIDVTIIEDIAVDAGPDVVNICEGETYTASVTPIDYDYTWQDGSTDPEFTITETGVYYVTMDDGCHVSVDSVAVNVIIPPEPFTLSANGILCDGEEIIYDFDPSLGDYEWQDGSDDAYYIVDNPGEYSLTISNMCGEEEASVEFIGMEAPDLYLGPDTIVLCDSGYFEIELYHEPSEHTVLWLDGTQSFSYIIDSAGHYGVTVTNLCGSATAVIDAVEVYTPEFSLGNDSLICGNSNLILSPGDFPGETFLWQDSSTLDSFIVLTPGEYAVTVSNVCGSDADTIQLNFQQNVVQPDLGADANLCPGETLTFSLSDPNATYVWQDGTVGGSYTISGPGQFIVTASNACSSLSDTLLVNLNNNPPSVDLPASITLCVGQDVVIDAGVSGVTYLWNDMTSNASITVTTPGTYSVTVSNSCGSDFDSVNVIDGGPAPVVELGNDIALCPGDSETITPAFQDVDTWLWSDGSTGSSIVINSIGETSVIVSNGCGLAYDTMNATLLNAVPTFSLGNDTAVCANEIVTLSVSVPNVNLEWSDGSTNNTLAVNNPGQYFATISNSCGDYADTINVSQLPAIPALNLGNDQSLCPGELIIIDPGILNVDYLWHDGSTATTFSTTQGVTISLTISNECGTSTDQLEVTESTQGPDVDLGADVVDCEGASVTIPSGISGVSYLWQDGSTQSSYTTSVSGEFMLTVTNSCGTDADTILVDLSGLPPVADLGTDLSLCEGDVVVLEANAPAGTMILWQDGSSAPTFTVTDAGTYTLQLTNECGDVSDAVDAEYTAPPAAFTLGIDTTICDGETITLTIVAQPGTDLAWSDGSTQPSLDVQSAGTYSATLSNQCGEASDAIAVEVTQAPLPIEIGNDTVLCAGESLTLLAPVTSDVIQWQDGSSAAVMIADESQVYSLQVSNACGVETDAFELFVIIDEPEIDFPQPPLLCPGDTISLNATQAFPAQYVWSTGETTSQIDVVTPGAYTVTVITDCFTIEQQVVIKAETDCGPKTKYFIPNIFSPNGDGLNDVFEIHFNADADVQGISGEIYDRWGNLLFASKSNPFTWDGTSDSQLLNDGVFVYRFTLQYTKGTNVITEQVTGDVTIIR